MTHSFPNGHLFVGGEWQAGTGAEIVSVFAAEGMENMAFKGASREDVLTAIDRAKAAQSDTAWRDLKPHERATYLYRISEAIAAEADRLSWLQSRDTSKTRTEARALVASAAATFRYFGAVLETSDRP